MCYEDVRYWSKLVDVINNRVSLVNFMLGFGRDGVVSNPCRLVSSRGRYRLMFCGEEYASFGYYDLEETQACLDRVSALREGLWLLSRTDYKLA